MKLRMILSVTLILFTYLPAHAINKPIYGDDNRFDIYEVTNSLFLNLANSTAAMIDKDKLILSGERYTINGISLKERGICKEERFANQITAATCSGFLVGKDLLVTAGHCIQSEKDCNQYRWIFDFNIIEEGGNISSVLASKVYQCAEILEQKFNINIKDDYALIRLNRVVIDREPLEVRTSGRVGDQADLVVIGHPTGLPTKIADDAYVRDNSYTAFFKANLDTFGGNSGSGVFDAHTGLVEGILVRGELDFIYDYRHRCLRPRHFPNNGGRGEEIVRITRIKKLMEIIGN